MLILLRRPYLSTTLVAAFWLLFVPWIDITGLGSRQWDYTAAFTSKEFWIVKALWWYLEGALVRSWALFFLTSYSKTTYTVWITRCGNHFGNFKNLYLYTSCYTKYFVKRVLIYPKFCGLSEYVRLQNVRLIIKSRDLYKWDSADFGKWAISRYRRVWGHCPPYGSYLGLWQTFCSQ